MSLELTLLKLLRTRSKFERWRSLIPKQALDTKTQILLDDYARYYRESKDIEEISFGPFWLAFNLYHPQLNDDARAVYNALLKKIEEPLAAGEEESLKHRCVATAAAHELGLLVSKWNDGEEIDMYAAMRDLVDRFEEDTDRKVKLPWVNPDINDLLKQEENDVGLHHRWPCLELCMRPWRPGDFIVFAGRPDKGKTTGMTDMLTYFAPQIDALFPDEDRPIIWLNNEGPGDRIVFRLYQSALDATAAELVEMNKGDRPLREIYAEALGGNATKIRVFDIHGYNNVEVEDIIRELNPAVIVFDMIDNINFTGALSNGGQRTDQLLEAMYQWARLIGVKYNATCIATSQISGDGDGLPLPTLTMLKDSKTGKQGAADVIITLGSSNDPSLENSRWIGCTKNKFVRSGARKSPGVEMTFDGDRGRIRQPQ